MKGIVTPRIPFDKSMLGCASGIHYFSSFKRAAEYDF